MAKIWEFAMIYRHQWKGMIQMELSQLFVVTLGKVLLQGTIVNTVLYVLAHKASWC